MDEATSRRVKMLRFPLIVLVLYIHSYIAPLAYRGGTVAVHPAVWLLVLQTAWSNGVARTAVPLFFLMSGYLYFLDFNGSVAAWREKTRRRVGTLLVPYVFWNVLVFGATIVGQALPVTAPYFNAANGRIADQSVFGWIDTIVGLTHYPAAYPFWFIRDLMLIVLVSPAIHWLVTRIGIAIPAALLLYWALELPFLPVPSIEGLAYFVAGAWTATQRRALFPPVGWLRVVAPLYFVLLAADVTQRTILPERQWFYTSAVAVGVVFVLGLVTLASRSARLSGWLVALSGASFFVFAAHEPLMTLLRKLLYRAAPPSQALIFTGYALLPLLLAAGLVMCFFVLRRAAPRFTSLISGGR